MVRSFESAEAVADDILACVGKTIVLGLPLGLGKANHIANALYLRAAADPSIRLTIFTALTLEKPNPREELERRFIGPVIERLFGAYPELAYARALHRKQVPPNIEIVEFFFLAGQWLNSAAAQQTYICANYTHALGYLRDRGVNVVAQLVARRTLENEPRYSLSCNTDITVDLLRLRAQGRADFRLYGQVNSELPFMPGDGNLPADQFAGLLETPATDFPLFAPPSEPVSDVKYAIGLHVASLVPDGGTLQIGIGQNGDALAQALILRHRDNAAFNAARRALSQAGNRDAAHAAPFSVGLYGVSEMFFEAFLALIKAGVVRREVDGVVLDAAFFLGPKAFYRALREMPEAELARIQMRAVSFTNELYGDEDIKRAARRDARFVNNAMMATLLGAVISDGLEDGRVVSGVGGQYNFVAQAFALEGARSIITLDAVRGVGRKARSNVHWSYGHETIPRHLRDIVVTEYGVADLRGKSDADVIAAMLAITDSRFQDELMRRAKDAGKLPRHVEIAAAGRDNHPERIARALRPFREAGALPSFPFGSDFTEVEQRLIPALQRLREASQTPLGAVQLALAGFGAAATLDDRAALARLSLDEPRGLKDRLYRLLVLGALRATKNNPIGS